MRKFKKLAAFTLTVSMFATVMTGCGGDKKEYKQAEMSEDSTLIAMEPTEDITFFYKESNDADGKWRVLEEAGKMTNVYLKPVVSKNVADLEVEFGTMIADPESMPDVVETYNPTQLSKYGAEGAFVKLNEYLDEFAPHIKAFLDENPEIRKRITAYDGNIYYIPRIPAGHVSTGWFIRQDWLDKLNLKAPTSKDELYNVLKAFKTQDPNGNGKDDEVPYFSNTSKVKCLFPLWDSNPGWYVDGDTVKFGPYEPEYKEAVSEIAKWYKEGLIDVEIYTRDGSAREKLFTDNVGGMTHDWFGSTALFNDSLADKVPGFKLKAIAPPSGVELESRPLSAECGWAISSNSKNIEILVRYFDFWFTEKGRRLANFGIEGEHYDMVDGKPVFKPELLKQADFKQKLTQAGAQMDIGYQQDFEYEKQWLNEDAIEGMDLYENSDFIVDQFPVIAMAFTPDEMEEYNNLKTQINTYVDEMQQKWILGSADVTTGYDEYISHLDSLGMKKLLEIQQNAYDRYMSQK